jgi:hypothetical protein
MGRVAGNYCAQSSHEFIVDFIRCFLERIGDRMRLADELVVLSSGQDDELFLAALGQGHRARSMPSSASAYELWLWR